jgi:hypothetical protein
MTKDKFEYNENLLFTILLTQLHSNSLMASCFNQYSMLHRNMYMVLKIKTNKTMCLVS